MPKPAIKQDRYQMTVAVLPDVMSELLFLQAFYAQLRNRPISLNDTVIQAIKAVNQQIRCKSAEVPPKPLDGVAA